MKNREEKKDMYLHTENTEKQKKKMKELWQFEQTQHIWPHAFTSTSSPSNTF